MKTKYGNRFDFRVWEIYPARTMELVRRLGWVIFLALPVVALSSAAALADEETGGEDAAKEDAPAPMQTYTPVVGGIDASKVPNDQKVSNAEKMIGEIKSADEIVTEKLNDARKSKDVVLTNCLRDKRNQIRAMLKFSDRALADMQDAMQGGVEDVINHQYTKIAVAHQRAATWKKKADQCVGEDASYVGDTDVSLEVDPDITEKDPTDATEPPPGPDVPPVASVF